MSSGTVMEKTKDNAIDDENGSESNDDSCSRSDDSLKKTSSKIASALVKGSCVIVKDSGPSVRSGRSRSKDGARRSRRRRSDAEEDDSIDHTDSESRQRSRDSCNRSEKSRRDNVRDRTHGGHRRKNDGYWNTYIPNDRYRSENRDSDFGKRNDHEWRSHREGGRREENWSREWERDRNSGRHRDNERARDRYWIHDRKTSRRRERSLSNDKENSEKRLKIDNPEVSGGRWTDGGEKSGDGNKRNDTESYDSSIASKEPPKSDEAKKKAVDILTSKTGGAYIPPAKLKLMQKEITDKSSVAFQRLSWEALKKSIHGLINRVNTSNIAVISVKLMSENIVRGRGLLCRSLMQAQAASPTFSNVFATLISIINTRFPATGELLIQRLVLQFRRSFRRNDKTSCINTTTFLAHLINMDVVHEILALEILTLLVENPTDHSIEVAISFLKECGPKIQEVSASGLAAVFDSLRHILHEGQLDKKVQYMIEVMFQMRKHFGETPTVPQDLDLVDPSDVRTHVITLEDAVDPQDILNVFKVDPNFVENEEKYQALKKAIVGDYSDASGSENEGSDEDNDEEEDEEVTEEKGTGEIYDNTETNLVSLRRTIYLTITSSLDFEECAHKLSCLQLRPGQEPELCHMFLDCCSQQRTYEKFYGLLAQRFCQMRKVCVGAFEQIFKDSYETIHRLETNKLRNVAKFFAHLLFTDAISWDVLSIIQLDMEHTNPSSRIFVKILFQELSEYMGLQKLNERVKDPTLQSAFEGLFPRHDPKDTRFAINFFTSIGLGGLTDELREHLKNQPKVQTLAEALTLNSSSSSSSSSTSSSSSSSSSSGSSSESDSSSSSDDSSGSEVKRRKKRTTSNAGKKKKNRTKKESKKKVSSKENKKRR